MTESSSASSELQRRLSGRYHVERLLGRGGMGAVHLARDLQLDRLVAIKELPDEFATDSALRERFLREVRMAASFSHPNIVPVYAVEEQGHSLAFVMGFVEGESLAERVRRTGPWSAREAVRLLLDVAYALAYAHGRGVVHRDIKPDNIMIERATGRALLMDFGVARSIGAAPSAQAGMTRVGEVVGTPEYMSPEQATGEELDGRSDLYSLGLVAHFALTGSVAFGGESAARVLMRQLTETLPPLASVRGDLPEALSKAIDRCLIKDRGGRFADAPALIEALDAAQAAAPEVPIAVRLFAQEAEMLLMLAGFMGFAALLLMSANGSDLGLLDRLVPVTVLAAVLVGRILQTRAEATRMLSQGFTTDAVMLGLRQLGQEREDRRAQLRADAGTVKRRKTTVRVALFMLLVSVVLFRLALNMRTGVPGNYQTPPAGVVLLFSALPCFGMGLVLLLRSPLRMSLIERVFRWIWLGAIGRRFVQSAAPRSSTSVSVVRAPAAAASSKAVVHPATSATASATLPSDARLEALEARLARLERQLDSR